MQGMRSLALLLAAIAVALGVAIAIDPSREAREILAAVAPHKPAEATILFGGDMMFDRSIRQYADSHGDDYLFSCLDSVLSSPDLVVANLEGPITENPSVSLGSSPGGTGNYTFTFPTTTAALLSRHHVGVVNLGNNHIYNQNAAGVRSTRQYLSEAGVAYFGDPLSNSVANIDVKGVPLSFVNYNEFIPNGGTASTTLAQIAAAKAQGRVPIVFAHWGDEYATRAPERVVTLAHAFVDAGAAAVIGSHPHVVEQSETYNGAPIFYSLGNLIFDQYWNTEVTHGLMVELEVGSTTKILDEIPVVLTRDRRTCPAQ